MTRNRVSAWAALALSLAANFYFMDRAHAQRVTKPRIPPVATELMTDAQRQRSAAVGTQDAINIELTMLNHPELSQDWEVFANHMLGKNTLPPHATAKSSSCESAGSAARSTSGLSTFVLAAAWLVSLTTTLPTS